MFSVLHERLIMTAWSSFFFAVCSVDMGWHGRQKKQKKKRIKKMKKKNK